LEHPQITVLDTGGQYCHLIARRVRELGVYADVMAADATAAELAGRRGVIISGGPSSVNAPGSPQADPSLYALGVPVLGICYGQQLIAHQLGGEVRRGQRGEYGLAFVDIAHADAPLFHGMEGRQQVWMSHFDQVGALPPGFELLGSTETCHVAAIGDRARRFYGVQFHPEVVQTLNGRRLLANFVFGLCGCEKDWEPTHQIPIVEEQIRRVANGRSVFFFASGGVDSTVAYTLCLRALGPSRVHASYVDTGLMREGETDFVRSVFHDLAQGSFEVADAQQAFVSRLAGVREPEQKRHLIGEEFVAVQERILEQGHYLDGDWILGQGTIYPDTIESGGTKKADTIKTHHNRVAGIQKLIEANRIVEPLKEFYKDEVRQLGRALGLPDELLDRHPFPGPGLAIRLLCQERDEAFTRLETGWLIPVHSVGVQGDERSYRPVLAIDSADHLQATAVINEERRANRVVTLLASHAPIDQMSVHRSDMTAERLHRLRRVDGIVRALSHSSGYDKSIWQFPVVLIPVGDGQRRDSVVLRPIDSVDGMTATAVPIPPEVQQHMCEALLAVEGVCGVFLDLTHKPPATIEWE
jgi:GMP synthase (glutamine-hydrolysing)